MSQFHHACACHASSCANPTGMLALLAKVDEHLQQAKLTNYFVCFPLFLICCYCSSYFSSYSSPAPSKTLEALRAYKACYSLKQKGLHNTSKQEHAIEIHTKVEPSGNAVPARLLLFPPYMTKLWWCGGHENYFICFSTSKTSKRSPSLIRSIFQGGPAFGYEFSLGWTLWTLDINHSEAHVHQLEVNKAHGSCSSPFVAPSPFPRSFFGDAPFVPLGPPALLPRAVAGAPQRRPPRSGPERDAQSLGTTRNKEQNITLLPTWNQRVRFKGNLSSRVHVGGQEGN